jgi:hypothetical protein
MLSSITRGEKKQENGAHIFFKVVNVNRHLGDSDIDKNSRAAQGRNVTSQ